MWNKYTAIKTKSKCDCTVVVDMATEEKRIQLIPFLIGLNDTYAIVRSNILMMCSLSFVMQVFNIISQEESHRSLALVSNKLVSSFVAKKPFKSKKKI